MSDILSTPNQAPPILANRTARASMRAQLRHDLLENRAGLRREREQSAAAAAVRTPRWRSARQILVAATAEAAAQEQASPAATTSEIEDPKREAPERESLEHEAPEPEIAVPLAAVEPCVAVQNMVAPDTTPAEPEAADQPPPAAESIFAGLMGDLALRQLEVSNRVAPAASPDARDAGDVVLALAEACAPAANLAAEPSNERENDAPATTITALGPGMLARLRLLGYARLVDLAKADPAALRHGLGDISRLLNVEGWIAEANRIAQRDEPSAL